MSQHIFAYRCGITPFLLLLTTFLLAKRLQKWQLPKKVIYDILLVGKLVNFSRAWTASAP